MHGNKVRRNNTEMQQGQIHEKEFISSRNTAAIPFVFIEEAIPIPLIHDYEKQYDVTIRHHPFPSHPSNRNPIIVPRRTEPIAK
jgi:hypothetical protein